jgi:hypothetical protein
MGRVVAVMCCVLTSHHVRHVTSIVEAKFGRAFFFCLVVFFFTRDQAIIQIMKTAVLPVGLQKATEDI